MGDVIPLKVDHESTSLFSPEAEQMILGLILLNNAQVAQVAAKGGADLFGDPCHADIYRRISELERDGVLASPVTLKQWALEHEGIATLGGPAYLIRMAGASCPAGLIYHYLDHLKELRSRRDLVSAIEDASMAIMSGEIQAAEVSARLESQIGVIEPGEGRGLVSMTKAVTEAAARDSAARAGEPLACVPTGVYALDKLMTGLFPGELVLLGGRPSMGKTSVAINVILNAARAGKRVAFASLEMTPEDIARRAMSEHMAGQGKAVAYRDLRAGEWSDMHHAAYCAAAKEVGDLPIQMMPRDYADIGALSAGAKQAKARMDGLDLLVIDYVQLMEASGTRDLFAEVSAISKGLKRLAGKLDIPILALSQLSRAVEQREDKRPLMSDLRQSGQLEQDADAVLFCYRDEYYLEREKPQDADELEAHQAALDRARNRLEIIIAKQRNGAIGTAHVMCNVAFNRIWEPQA